jgi:hypothetical protein
MEKILPNRGVYVIMVRSYGVIAKIIRFGMKVKMFLKGESGDTVNHADVLVDGMVSGSIAEGVTNRTVNTAYLNDGAKRELYVFKVRTNRYRKQDLHDFCLDCDNKKYEYLNFLWHAIYILKHKWFGKRGKKAENRVYCVEYVAMGLNKLFPGMIAEPWRIDPDDLFNICKKNFQLIEVINIPGRKK